MRKAIEEKIKEMEGENANEKQIEETIAKIVSVPQKIEVISGDHNDSDKMGGDKMGDGNVEKVQVQNVKVEDDRVKDDKGKEEINWNLYLLFVEEITRGGTHFQIFSKREYTSRSHNVLPRKVTPNLWFDCFGK